MTRREALEIVAELEKRYLDAPDPGNSPDSIRLFQQRAQQLEWAVNFTLEIEQMLARADTFYSTRRWEKLGHDHIKTLMHQSIYRVRLRINMAPDDCFESEPTLDNDAYSN
jgi:hypothetical protein